MADKNVETKVVQVRFDNSKFSKNIKATIKQTKELDKNLQFKGSKKEIKNVQKALNDVEVKQLNKDLEKTDSILHKITVGFKDLIKIKLLSRAMDVVINKSTALIKSMLGINNVVAGWQQYEEQMINVGGILNQVQNKLKDDGSYYGLADVTEAMDRLRWYTDETSFSFTTLSNGIRQFVVAGIDLNKASEAAMGVTNLAGSAKVFDEFKIQSAMDAVAKSMQTGYMDTMKWTTLTNTAGIVTEEFSQKLLDAAVAQGKLVKSAAGQYKTKKGGKLVTTENIRSTLSDRWLTSGVMETAMGEYASASTAVKKFSDLMADQTEESLAEINAMFKDSGKEFKSFDEILTQMPEDVEDATELSARQTGKFLERLGYQFDEVSYKAFKSSQETTSFSQSIESVRKGISTKWSEIFESIFGNYEQATELWSDVSDKFYDMFILPFANLSDVFKTWKDLTEGGAEDFRSMVKTIIDVIGRFKDAVGEGFKAVFGEIDESWLQKITITLKNFFENLRDNETLFKGITAVTKIFASVLKITSKISQTLFKIVSKIFVALEPVFDIVVGLVDKLADGIIWLIDTIDELGILDTIIKGLTTALEWLVTGIKKVFDWIKGKVDLKKIIDGLSKAVDKLREGLEWLGKQLTTGANKVKAWWKEQKIAQKVVENFSKAINKVKSAFSKTTDEVEAYNEALLEAAVAQGDLVKKDAGQYETKSGTILTSKNSKDEIVGALAYESGKTGSSLEYLNEVGEKEAKKLSWVDAFKNAFKSLGETFKNVWTTIKNFLDRAGILDALTTFWNSLKDALIPIWETIKDWFKSIAELAKTDPAAALKKIAGAILMVIGILMLLRIGGLMKRANWVLEEFYNIMKAFRKRLLAERWKVMTQALLYISASIFILTMAINNLADIKVKDTWKTMGLIGAIIAAYVGVLLVMTKVQGSIRGGFAAAMTLAATAIGLSIFINAFFKVLNNTKDISTTMVWRAAAVIAAMGSILVSVIAVTFRKVERTGLFKGSMVKGPGLFAMSKVILFIWAFMKLTFWFADQVNKMDDEQLKRAGISFGVVVYSLLVMYAAFNGLAKAVTKTDVKTEVVQKKFSVDMGGFLLIVLSALAIFKIASGLSLADIGKGTLTMVAIFGAIIGLVFALTAATKILNKLNPKKEATVMSVHMGSIAFAVLVSVFTFKLIRSLDWGEVFRGILSVTLLYAAVAVMAKYLAGTSVVIKARLTKAGFNKQTYKNPIVSSALAISFSVLALVAAIKLVNYIDPQEFAEGLSRITVIMTMVTVFSSILNRMSKQVDGKSMVLSAAAMFGSVIAVIAISLFLGNMPKDTEAKMYYGMGIVAILLAVVIALSGFIMALQKVTGSTKDRAKSLAINMASIIVSIGVLVGLIAIMGQVMKYMSAGEIQGSVILFAALGSLILALSMWMIHVARKIPGGQTGGPEFVKKLKTLFATIGVMIGSIAVLVGLIAITSKISVPKLWAGVAVITALTGVITLFLFAFIKMVPMVKDNKTLGRDSLKLMMVVGLMTAALYGIIGAIAIIGVIGWQKAWFGMAVAGVILAGLAVMILAIAGVSKLVSKTGVSAITLLALGALMVIFGVAIAAIVGAIYLITEIDESKIWRSVGIVGGIAIVLTIITAVLMGMSKGVSAGKMGVTIALVAVIAAAIVAIAAAILIISKIPTEGLVASVTALGIMIVLMGVLVAVLAGLGASGLGEIGAGLLLAIAAAVLIFAAALWVGAKAMEVMNKSIIELMNNLTLEKIGLLLAFSAALMALAGAQMIAAISEFGAALLGVGSSLLKFGAALVDLGTSVINFLSGGLDALTSIFKAVGESIEAGAIEKKAKAYERLAGAMTTLQSVDISAIGKGVEAVGEYVKLGDEKDKLEAAGQGLVLFGNGLSFVASMWDDRLNAISALIDKIMWALAPMDAANPGSYSPIALFMLELDKLKELIDSIGDPVIKPVLDLEEFRKGMVQMSQDMLTYSTLYDNYAGAVAAKGRQQVVDKYIQAMQDTAGALGSPQIIVNQTYNLNDQMAYSYDAARETGNAIDQAVRKASWLDYIRWPWSKK